MWNLLTANGRGAVWILISALFLTGQAIGIKSLGGSIEFMQIVFVRALMSALFILPFVIGGGRIRTSRPFGHLLRGVFGIAGMSCIVFALTRAPLAEVTTISFTRSLFAIVLAVILLREAVGWRRGLAAAAGFAGVVIMLRPGFGDPDPALMVALAGTFFGACAILTIKQLSRTEASTTIVFYFALSGILLTAGPAAWFWVWPTAEQWLILIALSAAGTIAQTAMVRGWSTGEAAVMAPFTYAQLLFAVIAGYLLFAEILDGWTVAGAAVIVGSTLYIARREALKGKRGPGAGLA